MNLDAILAQATFFKGLSEGNRRALAEVGVFRHVATQTVLFREGETGHSIFLLTRGRIALFKTGPDYAEVHIKVVAPGEVFAEVILFEQDRFPVTARTLTECSLYLFARRDIRWLLGREEFRNDFMAMMLRRQRYLAERIMQLTSYDVEERFFLFLREQYGDSRRITLDYSKKALAAAIGTTPETLSRLIRRLQKEGRLQWRGRTVLLPDQK